MKRLKGKELELGGPKIKFRCSKMGEGLKNELTEILKASVSSQLIPIKQKSPPVQYIKEELIQEIIINIYDEILEEIQTLLEYDNPKPYITSTLTQIQKIIQRELNSKL